MKKNKMMRLASAMMVLTLMSTSVISGTFAKYVTQDSASDSARVAKWGVTVAATGSLYGEKYAADDSKITASEETDVVSVYGKQSTENKVVAPGTMSDKGFHFSVTGKPEVDAIIEMDIEHQNIFLAKGEYGVMVEVTDITKENYVDDYYYTKNGETYSLVKDWAETLSGGWYELHDATEVTLDNGYWPVVYTMTGSTPYDAGDVESDSLKAIADKVAAKISTTLSEKDLNNDSLYKFTGITKAIEQNTDIATILSLDNVGLSWAWEFDYSGAGTYDGEDTILGNLMAERIGGNTADVVKLNDSGDYVQPTEGKDYCLDTKFDITIKATQVD